MRSVVKVATLLVVAFANLSAATAADSIDAGNALSQGTATSLRGGGTDNASIERALLSAIEADELVGAFDASTDLVRSMMHSDSADQYVV